MSLKNLRQLGGYPTEDGKKVKRNLLFRSASLAELTEEECYKLSQEYGIVHIVDFRSEYEKNLAPDIEVQGTKYHWINVMKYERSALGTVAEVKGLKGKMQRLYSYVKTTGGARTLYRDFVISDLGQKGFAKFFRIVLDSEGACLWHCTEGKDRTGFAAILLLLALGVARDIALDDFEISNIAQAEKITEAKKTLSDVKISEEDLTAILALVGVERKYMEEALGLIDQKFGGVNAYLKNQLGLTEEDFLKLRAKYLE